jgi:polysaccharide biosynthesis protein PslG
MSVSFFSRALVSGLLLTSSLLATGSSGVAAQPADPGVSSQPSDPRFFAQTGFRLDTDAFWSFFQARGGVRTFGYPVSRTFKLDGFPVQIFQRIVVQLQPDGSVATLNLLDPGLMPYTQINGSTFPAPDPALVSQTPSVNDPDYATKIIQFTQDNAPDVFNGSPVNYFHTFSTTVSYDDAFPNGDGPQSLVPLLNLQIWGAPTSKPAADPANSNFIYQRFQRGIMHYDSGCNCTQGLLLADYLKSILTGQNLPPDLEAQARTSRYYRQYAPTQPLSIARPADLVGSDLTGAFVQQTGGASAPNAAPTPAPASGPFAYGFQVQLWYFNQDAKQQTLGLVKQAGFTWVKHQVEWMAIETAPGQFNWAELDAIVATAASANQKVLLSVQHAPVFYRGPASGLFPSDPNTYQQFMQALAGRYRGRVQAYEIWNEENLSRETGDGNVDPSHYLPILKAGSAGTRAGDPSAQVLLGAPSPTGANIAGQSIDDLQYLQQLYALNGGEAKAYYDAISAHPSGFSNPPDCTPQTPQCSLSGGFNNDPSFFAFTRVAQYRDLMVQNGESSKKVWFTEFGYCSSATPPAGYEYCKSLTAQNQADFLVQAFQKARSLDYVGGMFVWNLNFAVAVPSTDEKWGFSVLRDDWSPRPAYFALAQMAKQ